MKRKIVKHGPSSLTMSLPSKWVKEHGLKPGDEIEVEEKPDGLLVKSTGEKKLNSVEVDVSGPSKLVRRYIGNLYRKGVDEMRLTFTDPSHINDIQKHVANFFGLEITEQGKNYCVVKNVANVKDEEFDNMLNRMFLVTLNMGEDLIEGMKKKDFDVLKNISILENTHNKLFNFCLRVINKPNFDKNVYFMGHLLIRLEDAGDRLRDIAEYLVENPKLTVSKETIILLEEIHQKMRKVYELYNKFDKEKALHILDKKKELTEKAAKLIKTIPKDEIIIIHHLKNLINDLYETASPMFGLNL